MLKELAYQYHDKQALKAFAIICAFVFVNSSFVGFVGIVPSVVYLGVFFIMCQYNPLVVFGIILTAMLMDDMFVYDMGIFSYKKHVCAINCQEIFNMGFIALIGTLTLKKQFLELFKSLGSQGNVLMLLLFYLLLTCFVNSYEYDNGLGEIRRFAQFFVFYLLSAYFMRTDEGMRHVISVLAGFTLLGSIFGVFMIATGAMEQTFAGCQLIFSIPILGGLLYRKILKGDFPITKYTKALIAVWASASLLLMSESRRNFILISVFFVYALLKLQIYRRILFAMAMAIPMIFVGKSVISDTFSQRLEVTSQGVTEIIQEQEVSQKNRVDFFTGRDVVFAYSMAIFLENSILGIGLNNSYEAIGKAMGESQRPHNFYLQILLETGIIGSILYLTFMVLFTMGLRKTRRINLALNNMPMVGLAEGLMIFTLGSHAVALFGMYLVYDKFYWFSYALGLAIMKVSESNLKKVAQ